MSRVENANPTIRSSSDLPSRLSISSAHQSATKASLTLLTSTIPSSAYIPDPFSPSPPSSDLEDSDDDNLVEPIDEQEIYGIPPPNQRSSSAFLLPAYLLNSPPYRSHLPNRRSRTPSDLGVTFSSQSS